MLILSRKPNQSVIVEGSCRITVLKSSCKLGIEGPAKVLREELVPKSAAETPADPIVYLVDDDADLLQAYQRYLKHFDMHVKMFSHGGEFLKSIEGKTDASAAVLDLRLAEEDIDGLQILQQLRAWDHDYPVILLTGYGDVDTCRRAFLGGCYTFLQKPVAPEDLAATISEATKRHQRGEIGRRYAFNSLLAG